MMPYFDRFDICEAYWCFFTDYHNGQSCPYYRRLCLLQTYFKPRFGVLHDGSDELTDNGKEIYKQLVEREANKRVKS